MSCVSSAGGQVTSFDGDAQMQLPRMLEEMAHWRETCAELQEVGG